LIPTLDRARSDPNIPQMPPIVSHLADTKDTSALESWIRAMGSASPDAAAGDAQANDAQPGDASGTSDASGD
jgi:hypothetical protein